VIHVVTLEPFEADEVQAVCKALTAAFGMGTEHVGELEIPDDAQEGDKADAVKLLAEAGPVKTFADDKILFLVHSPLAARPSPAGALPTQGYAKYGGDKAVASAAGLPADPAARTQALCKLAVHQVGHLWELHHCLDYRCAMMPPWGVSYARTPAAELCSFCREKSERRMKTASA
jgi:predicted Zn-dependent protease